MKKCNCGSGLDRYDLVDARGIFVAYVCEICESTVKEKYRPEIFDSFDYEADEPIEDPDFDDNDFNESFNRR